MPWHINCYSLGSTALAALLECKTFARKSFLIWVHDWEMGHLVQSAKEGAMGERYHLPTLLLVVAIWITIAENKGEDRLEEAHRRISAFLRRSPRLKPEQITCIPPYHRATAIIVASRVATTAIPTPTTSAKGNSELVSNSKYYSTASQLHERIMRENMGFKQSKELNVWR